MTIDTGIEWTDSTWNPVRGCTRVSEGCKHCYAELLAARFSDPGQWGHGLAKRFIRPDGGMEGRWTGQVGLADDRKLTWPLRFKGHPQARAEGRPTRIFVNSTSDLFHEALPDSAIDRVFAVMALTPQHTYQVLTKRPERMRAYLSHQSTQKRIAATAAALFPDEADPPGHEFDAWPLPNVWLGTSAEDQAAADARIPELLATPAAVRFLSAEPLLAAIDLECIQAPRYVPEDHELDWKFSALQTGDYYAFQDGLGVWEGGDGPHREGALDWVICGGESGLGARPMHPDWARELRDQCAAAGVPFFFKQWGDWKEAFHERGTDTEEVEAGSEEAEMLISLTRRPGWISRDGQFFEREDDLPEELPCRLMDRVGKKAAGRRLDGRTHDDMPARAV